MSNILDMVAADLVKNTASQTPGTYGIVGGAQQANSWMPARTAETVQRLSW